MNYKKFKPSGEERKGASEEAAVSDRPAPQKGRMLKAACLPCDYVMRAAAQTLRRGVPLCPMCGMKMWHEELPEEAGTAQQPEESPEPSDMRPVPGDAQ